jgi:hypothetical protein
VDKIVPRRTAPRRTAPHRTAPHRTTPHRTAPRRAAPRRAAPGRAAARHAGQPASRFKDSAVQRARDEISHRLISLISLNNKRYFLSLYKKTVSDLTSYLEIKSHNFLSRNAHRLVKSVKYYSLL